MFKGIKAGYNKACEDYILANPAAKIYRWNFCRFFGKAWDNITPDVISSGFRACGIWPLNPVAIPEEAYAASNLTTYLNTPDMYTVITMPVPRTSSEAAPGRTLPLAVPSATDALSDCISMEIPLQLQDLIPNVVIM